ncbi:MAG: PAS domain S-box protein [Acidobacteria bacterium]|nr:PAS domain S-box protein [Acidobacteriota bacterium]
MPALPKIKVLYAAARRKSRATRKGLLREAEFEVLETHSAQQAWQLIHQHHPEVLLLDEKLDDLTALELCRHLKADARTRRLPILLCAAKATSDKPKTHELASLVDAWLWPFTDGAQVAATIKQLLRQAKAQAPSDAALQPTRLLIESNTLPTLVFDPLTETILAVNEALINCFGYTRSELHAMKVQQLFATAEAASWVNYLSRIPQSENALQWQLQKRDGSLIDGEAIWQEIRWQEAPALLCFLRDITERKCLEAALRERERHFRLLAESAPVMVWASGTDKLCIFFNRHWLEFTGRTLEQEIGNGWAEGVHPDDLKRCLEIYSTFFEAREPFSMDYRLRRYDGEYRWVLDKGVPRFSEAGVFEGYIGSCMDITDRKQVEGEREYLLNREQRARAEAETANRAKDAFLAVVSHELRAPLNAMLGWSRILQYKQVDEATQAMALETIERSARMQAQIIEDLLDTTRIISGKLRIEVQPVNLAPVIQAAVDTMRPAADAKGIEICVSLYAETDMITGDAERLQQVVWNLVSNAIKFTPSGGRVEVLLQRVDPAMQLVVKDNGQGIKPEMMPYVFDRFYQIDRSNTRRQSGLGLGLSLVRHLVELHGGTITVESAGENQGASFTVNLPVRAVRSAAVPEATPSTRSQPAMDFDMNLDGLWVLAVDDEADARELLTTLLKQYGAKVTAVGSANDAFKVIAESEAGKRPDILVSDIGMPEEDGYTLIRRVRQLAPKSGGRIPAVALTAYGRASDRVKALTAGFQSHVPKPVDLAELIAVIASLTTREWQGGRSQAHAERH